MAIGDQGGPLGVDVELHGSNGTGSLEDLPQRDHRLVVGGSVDQVAPTVDPDTGGPDDGQGIAPRVMVIDRAVEVRPRTVGIAIKRDPIKIHDGRTCRDGRKLRVSILSSATFDAQSVDPGAVRLGDPRLAVTVPPPSGEKALKSKGGSLELEFSLCEVINAGALDAGTTELQLTATTRAGFAIAGRDAVHVE